MNKPNKSNKSGSLSRIAGLALGVLMLTTAAGCGDSGPIYSATVFLEPGVPISGKNVTMRVELKTVAGAVVNDATIRISGSGPGGTVATVALATTETAGTYATTRLVFPGDGAYTLSMAMSSSAGDETHTVPVTATCATNGEAGAPCCAADACGKGLSCVYGVCRANLQGDGGPCHGKSECQSGVCSDATDTAGATAGATGEKCLAPKCDDGVLNGAETDLDCGGGCPTACGILKVCKVAKDCKSGECWKGVCDLGAGEMIGIAGSKDAPKLTEILKSKLGLGATMNNPADLAFNPNKPGELWVVNPPTDSFTVIFNTGKTEQKVATVRDISDHFLEHVNSIDFSDNDFFGTCGESANDYNGKKKANGFMGPVLWPAQYTEYVNKQSAHQVHGDMLHSSPFCMGITGITDNQYFVFNGHAGRIDRYDFGQPHVPGGTFHGDGEKRRYIGLKVKRLVGTASHMEYVSATGWLYVADTGNKRVLRMNDKNATKSNALQSFGGDGKMYAYKGEIVEVLAETPGGLAKPSGIAVHKTTLYVADAHTGAIHAYDTEAPSSPGVAFGKHLRTFKTGLAAGKLGGIEVGPDRRLYIIDRGGRILRIDP